MNHQEPQGILYDARTVRPGMSGVGRYSLNLLAALAALPDAPPLRALFLPEVLPRARRDAALTGVDCLAAPFSHEAHPAGDLWLWRGVRRMIRPGEVYHGPAFIIPGGPQPFPRVVTVHDLFPFTHPRFYPLKFRIWLRWATTRACRFAERVIVPAEHVRQDVIARGMASAEKVVTIAEAPDATDAVWDEGAHGQGRQLESLLAGAARPTILTVGTLDTRKDPRTARVALVELAALLRRDDALALPLREGVKWIWIGGPGPVPDDSPEELKQAAAGLGFVCAGHAPGALIRPALRAADVYVTCSRTEGFGIPLVEAMAAGCPILASDIPVHREVAGDAALFFPEGDAPALARLLARLWAEEGLRAQLGARGLARAPRFRWRTAAELTLENYREAWSLFHERSQTPLYQPR